MIKNIQKYLPSKKIQLIIIVIIGLFAAYGLYKLVVFIITPKAEKNIFVSLVDNFDPVEDAYLVLDSDNDGAYDWEEELWPGLDPFNPDSDGDGVLDGQYIDIQNALAERERAGGVAVETNLSETEKLGRSLFTALLAIQKTSGGLDAETEDQISGNVADYITDLSFADNVYTRNMLFLVADTKANSYKYRDEMKNVFRDYPVATSDIELIINATDNPKEFQAQLRSAHLKYKAYLEKIVAMNVPFAIANQHTRLINVVGKIEAALFNLTQEETDELVSLSAIVQMESIMNQVVDTVVKINDYFEIVSTTKEFEKAEE